MIIDTLQAPRLSQLSSSEVAVSSDMSDCIHFTSTPLETRYLFSDIHAGLSDGIDEVRLESVLSNPVKYIYAKEFDEPDAADRLLRPLGPDNFLATKRLENCPAYIADLSSTSLLDAKQEAHLFRCMNFQKYRAKGIQNQASDSGQVSNADHSLFHECMSDAGEIRRLLIESNLRLVFSIAKRFSEGDLDLCDELVQEGNIILMNSVESFDCSTGYKFSTYATTGIRRRFLRYRERDNKRRRRHINSSDELLREQESLDGYLKGYRRSIALTLAERLLENGVNDGRDRQITKDKYGVGTQSSKVMSNTLLSQKYEISGERCRQLIARAIKNMQAYAKKENIEYY